MRSICAQMRDEWRACVEGLRSGTAIDREHEAPQFEYWLTIAALAAAFATGYTIQFLIAWNRTMTGFGFGQLIEIAANVGVIAGIVFLAFEIRQNNALLAAQAREALHASRRDINLMIASTPDFAEIVDKVRANVPLSGGEAVRLEALQRSVMVTMEWQFEEYRRGRLSLKDLRVDSWSAVFSGKGTFGALYETWEKWKLQTSPEFVRFIEERVMPRERD